MQYLAVFGYFAVLVAIGSDAGPVEEVPAARLDFALHRYTHT